MTASVVSAPPVFDALVGQPEAVATLSGAAAAAAAVVAGTPADPAAMTHAWLFTGPPGSGRSVAARAFAAALQCRGRSAAATARPATPPSAVPTPTSGSSCRKGCQHRGRRDARAGTARRQLAEPGPLAGGTRRGRRPAHRSGRQRAAQGDRGAAAADGFPAVYAVDPSRRHLGDDPFPVPGGAAAAAAGRRGGRRAARGATVPIPTRAAWAAAAAQGHVGRARRLARDPQARSRRDAVLAVPRRLTGIGACFDAANALIEAAEAEAAAVAAEVDGMERAALETALGAGGTGRGAARRVRGTAGQLKDLERRQKSRATRAQRDALDRALVDLAAFYRDVLARTLRRAGRTGPRGHRRAGREPPRSGGRRRARCAAWRPSSPAATPSRRTSSRGSRWRR